MPPETATGVPGSDIWCTFAQRIQATAEAVDTRG
jgi:hypothetical protein